MTIWGTIKSFDGWNLGFCLILLWILMIRERMDFWVGVWINQLYGFQKRQAAVSVFATPYTLKATVFLYFSMTEEMFDKAVLDYLSSINSNKCLNYNFIVFLIKTCKLVDNKIPLCYYKATNKTTTSFRLEASFQENEKSCWQQINNLL